MISEEKIEEVKNRLIDTYHPLEIYIFGSYAWGIPEEDSDLDLLVVVQDLKKDRYETLVEGHRALMGMGIPKDILVYSKKEFEEHAKDIGSICYRVKNKGKKIYGRV